MTYLITFPKNLFLFFKKKHKKKISPFEKDEDFEDMEEKIKSLEDVFKETEE